MSELKNGVMLIENALRCVAQDIELYYKKKAPNGAWCIATCRNAAAQFEQVRSKLAELRRAQPENEPLTCDGCEHDGSYENEREYGYPSPCTKCRRIATDNYRRKPERSEG